jgi:hypothetical protein
MATRLYRLFLTLSNSSLKAESVMRGSSGSILICCLPFIGGRIDHAMMSPHSNVCHAPCFRSEQTGKWWKILRVRWRRISARIPEYKNLRA